MKVNVSGCSVEEAMRLLGGRWRLLIVSYLVDGPKRLNELRREALLHKSAIGQGIPNPK